MFELKVSRLLANELAEFMPFCDALLAIIFDTRLLLPRDWVEYTVESGFSGCWSEKVISSAAMISAPGT